MSKYYHKIEITTFPGNFCFCVFPAISSCDLTQECDDIYAFSLSICFAVFPDTSWSQPPAIQIHHTQLVSYRLEPGILTQSFSTVLRCQGYHHKGADFIQI